MRVIIFRGLLMPAIGLLFLTLSSCNNQFYRGYGYKGSTGAPDVNPELRSETVSESPISGPTVQVSNESQHQLQQDNSKLAGSATVGNQAPDQSPLPQSQIAEITPTGVKNTMATQALNAEIQAIALDEAGKLEDEGKELNHENLARNLGKRLTDEGIIKALTPGQERKMTRLAAKIDKKAQKQGKEIDWKNNTGLELFFMIMAIGGLVLGIVGVGIGWFVFIVFAGLWLYFKLVKD